ncbi:hypothetical protein COTS27_01298 [Spirochaetota bacterium]|nr:hypothetical protein COTS27_01298 [Spirochaetota bacterium]
MRAPKIAIMGDHFMKPEFFVAALKQQGVATTHVRTYTLPWPNEPLEHGYAEGRTIDDCYEGMRDLREYQGDPAHVASFIGDAEIFITHLAPMPKEVITEVAARGKLKLVAVSRGGATNIDIPVLSRAKILIINTPGRNASAVAEFTIGAILMETRLIRLGHEALKKGRWRGDLYHADHTGLELSELTVGLIGYGHIGRAVAKLLHAFNTREILIADPYVKHASAALKGRARFCDLDTLLKQSDVVNLSARLTPKTYRFITTEHFNLMKRGAYFINVARGPLVNYDALYKALRSGHLRGAMLDTFALEPVPSNDRFLKLDNVTVTPHIAGASRKTCVVAAGMIAEDISAYVAGRPCKHHVV